MALKEDNLISCSPKIRTGQRLVKVGSTFMPVGIGGATPPDTSDASATADDILKDKTAYAGNDLIQGTIPSKDAETFIPGTADQIIEKKQYLAGDQIIRGDAALIPENIIKGASIFGVEGAFSGGGNAEFYKCTSVSDDTWCGRKLEFIDGKYCVQSQETKLLKITGFTPHIGDIYNADTSIFADYNNTGTMEEHAPVYYAPLTENLTSTLGDLTAIDTNYSFTTYQGKPCIYLNNTYLYQNFGLLPGNSPYSLSLWANLNNSAWDGLVTLGSGVGNEWSTKMSGFGIIAEMSSRHIYATHGVSTLWEKVSPKKSGGGPVFELTRDVWHHIVLTYDGNFARVYLDGKIIGQKACSNISMNNARIEIGRTLYAGAHNMTGYITNVQIYDYAVSKQYIAETLYANEFMPTTA